MKPAIPILIILASLFYNIQASAQTCTITCPANLIVMADSSKEGAVVNFPAAKTSGECGAVTYQPAPGSFFRLGSHTVTATTASGQKCYFTITVTDNESPSLSAITLSRNQLWPASNKMKKVGVYYTASDNSGDSLKTVLAVSSNATMNGDWEIVNDHLLRLKAARLPDGSPRIYTITVTTTDAAGNSTKRTTSIAVSRTMVAKPL